MADGREYELKFLIDEAGIAQVLTHPALASALREAAPSPMQATYFDTPDQRLRRHGISLRIRQADGRKTETVKQAGPSVVDRGEWEFETEDEVPNLHDLRHTPVGHYVREDAEHDLQAAFTVAVERTKARVVQGSAEIELAIDRGTVEAGGKSCPISELELELKSGEPADLFGLARLLLESLPLTPALVSKAERGFRLLDGPDSDAPNAFGRLTPDMPATAAFQTLAEACLKEVTLNAASITRAIDVEAVHRTRVALRRLRAAFSLFRPLLESGAFDAIRGELKWMSDILGGARDRDVFQTELFDPAARNQPDVGADELAEHMRVEQRQAHAGLADALESRRWRLALGDLIEWISKAEWQRTTRDAEPSLAEFAAARLRAKRKSVLRKGAGLADLPPDARHDVRIRAKKLRYSLTFFASVPRIGRGSKQYRGLQKGLEVLQASLGHLHDHEAQQDLLRTEVESWAQRADAPGKRAAFAAGRLMGDPPDLAADLNDAKRALRKVRKNQPF